MHSHARTSAKIDATLVLSRSLLCPNSFSGNGAAKFSKKMSAAFCSLSLSGGLKIFPLGGASDGGTRCPIQANRRENSIKRKSFALIRACLAEA